MKALILLPLLLSPSALASVPSGLTPQPLVVITNDKDSEKAKVSLLKDKEGRPVGIYSQGSDSPAKTFWFKDMEKPQGVPLVEREGYTVITLQGALNRETLEGRVTAKYLVNAVFGTKEHCEFEIRQKSGNYYIRNIYTKKAVNKIHVVTGKVGVRLLQGLCPGGK